MEKIVGHDELISCLKILGALDPDDRQRVIRSICAFYPPELAGQESKDD